MKINKRVYGLRRLQLSYAFEMWYWRTLLRVPWAAWRSNQSVLKEISPCMFIGRTDAEAAILWLPDARSQLIRKRPWCWERLRANEEGGERRWDDWMASPTQWTWVWANSGRQWSTGKPGLLQFTGLQRVRHDLATEQQQYHKLREPFVRPSLVSLDVEKFLKKVNKWRLWVE